MFISNGSPRTSTPTGLCDILRINQAFPSGEGKGDANMCLHNIIRCRIYVYSKRVAEDVDPYGLVRHFTNKQSLPLRGKVSAKPTDEVFVRNVSKLKNL